MAQISVEISSISPRNNKKCHRCCQWSRLL